MVPIYVFFVLVYKLGCGRLGVAPEYKKEKVGEFVVNLHINGSGKNLLILHDITSKSGMREMEPFFKLSRSFKIISLDLIGFGMSSKTVEIPNYRFQAGIVSELIEKLGLEGPSILGVGWGGQIALELAITHPEIIYSVVLVDPTYDKEQLQRLKEVRAPVLILFSEDNMLVQLKAAYILRDMIRKSRLELVGRSQDAYLAAKSERLCKYATETILHLIERFISDPESMVREKPEMEKELKGIAQRDLELS